MWAATVTCAASPLVGFAEGRAGGGPSRELANILPHLGFGMG